MGDIKELSTEQASAGVEAVLEEARKRGISLAVAVVDAGGNLLYFGRRHQEPAAAHCSHFINMAMNKAYTASILRMNTRVLQEFNTKFNHTLLPLNNPRFNDITGGIYIKASDGTALGGIGVSGLSEEGDEEMALIGLKAMSL
jgi:uncharacterized protein GlcG (DUF336 family)